MEAFLKADQRNRPCIMLTVVFKFNYCLLLLLSRWVLIFLEKVHMGSLLGLFFHQNWVLIRSVFWLNGSFSSIGCTASDHHLLCLLHLLTISTSVWRWLEWYWFRFGEKLKGDNESTNQMVELRNWRKLLERLIAKVNQFGQTSPLSE